MLATRCRKAVAQGACDSGMFATALYLESTIVARNTAADVESDIGTAIDEISGSHNLILVGTWQCRPTRYPRPPARAAAR